MNLGSNTLIPIYDNEDSVCGIIYNDEPYYFQKNLQGDIVGIVDKDAKVVAKYSYDAWGVCTVTSDNSNVGIANVNMFRYRGYYYDFEIGMYYLWSRYFDPSIGRFINSDNPDIFVLYSVIENNLYTYCLNNPINNRDEKGRLATWIVKKIVSVILGVFVGLTQQFLSDVFLSAYNRKFSISSLGTYVSSAVNGGWDALWGGGIAVEICKSLISNIIGQMVDMWNGGEFDFEGLMWSIADGLFSYVLNKVFKTPKFIRDIKDQAVAKGIKGTKKLMKFLNKRVRQIEITKFTFGAIKEAIKSFVTDCLNYAKECAKEFYNDLCSLISPRKPTVNSYC